MKQNWYQPEKSTNSYALMCTFPGTGDGNKQLAKSDTMHLFSFYEINVLIHGPW